MFPSKGLRKSVWIAIAVLGVIGLYSYVYRGAFQPKEILITHRVVVGPPLRGLSRTNLNLRITQLAFGLDRNCRLTEIKVISVAGLKAGSNTAPLWHLVSDSNSIPVKAFAYGDHIRGLRPLVQGSQAMPLEPNVTYRLFLRAGREAGQHDFSVGTNIFSSR